MARAHHAWPCCRLLGLAPAAQAIIFDFYQAVLEHTLAVARKEGRFDDGITSVTGTSVTLAGEPQVSLAWFTSVIHSRA